MGHVLYQTLPFEASISTEAQGAHDDSNGILRGIEGPRGVTSPRKPHFPQEATGIPWKNSSMMFYGSCGDSHHDNSQTK